MKNTALASFAVLVLLLQPSVSAGSPNEGLENRMSGSAITQFLMTSIPGDEIGIAGRNDASGSKIVPKVFELHQNYPNPFNPSTTISFTVPSDGKATLAIFNLLGEQVATIFAGLVSSGRIYHVKFDGSEFPSGVYFSRLQFTPAGLEGVSTQVVMRKMMLVK